MKHSNTFKEELTKFCYIPFHGFCIDPQGWLTMCCMDPRGEIKWQKNKEETFPRLYKKSHIDDVEDLQEWWVDTYEVVWQKYFDNEQHSITPCVKCFDKNYTYISSKKKTVKEWALDVGIKRQTIERRLKLGWSDYDAVMQPVIAGQKFNRNVT